MFVYYGYYGTAGRKWWSEATRGAGEAHVPVN